MTIPHAPTAQENEFIEAVKNQNVNRVTQLLERGVPEIKREEKLEPQDNEEKIDVNVEVPEEGTALHIAVKNGDLAMVKALVVKGAKTYVTDRAFNLPIQYAIDSRAAGREEILFYLIRHRTPFDKASLEEGMLAYCREFYEGTLGENDKKVLDFAASRLTATNVDLLLRDDRNREVWLAHLNSMRGDKEKPGCRYANDVFGPSCPPNTFA